MTIKAAHKTLGRIAGCAALALLFGVTAEAARAQSATDWLTGRPADSKKTDEQPTAETAHVRLVARLTADGEEIEDALVWRVFWHPPGASRPSLIATKNDAKPTFKLGVGDYVVNVALGQANLTRRISVKGEEAEPAVEEFVLNAGGLRVKALVSGLEAPNNTVSYAIYSDRDQTDSRKLVISAARPNLVVRLNAGIYHIVSTYGDCNAVVQSDVTVEAGKLTEATVTHSAAKATFKLVHRAGGEALPDTQWSIQTVQGEEIKGSVGALPTHILAPGSYTVVAKTQGRAFQRDITLANGETAQVELVMN